MNPHPLRLAWGTVATALLGCDAVPQQDPLYSLTPSAPLVAPTGQSDDLAPKQLHLLLELGVADTPTYLAFGGVADAAWRSGRVYVVDQQLQRVLVFDALTRGEVPSPPLEIGGTGTGPGEFLSPSRIVLDTDRMAVFDERQGRVSVFGLDGEFRSSFPVSISWVEDMALAYDGSILLSGRFGTPGVQAYGWDGSRLWEAPLKPLIEDSLRGNWIPTSGRLCTTEKDVVYANPWTYEVIGLDPHKGGERRPLVSVESERWRPVEPWIDGVTPEMPGVFVLGLACLDDYLIAAYMDVASRVVHYDVFDWQFNLLDQLSYPSAAAARPGIVADAVDDVVVTISGLPFFTVRVFQVR